MPSTLHSNGAGPRIAILGFHLEANAFAPVTTLDDFLKLCWVEGEEISTLARGMNHMPSEVAGFYGRMDATGPWCPVPLIIAAAPPGGPVDDAVWTRFLDGVLSMLRGSGPVDAIYIANHGAASGVSQDDIEGDLVEALRKLVGADVPIVCTYDLHCNVSDRTIANLDALIAYRTNPHVDQRERAADAAVALREWLGGTRLYLRHVRLPLTPPSVTLLTKMGPYADMVTLAGQRMATDPTGKVVNISVTAGFVFSDLPKCGMGVAVTVRDDPALAETLAREIAQVAWDDRHRYVANMITVEQAVARAAQSSAPVLFADVADNPGGGGGGNTVWLLRAFNAARVEGAVFGVQVDPTVVETAFRHGPGWTGVFTFNPAPGMFAETYAVEGRVVRLSDGDGIGRRGILQGRKFSLGRAALLALQPSGLLVLVGSLRRQLSEPVMLEMHGIDIAKVRCLVVKSRGHYRAGFDEFFADDVIFDVDSDGMTTPNLKRVPFRKLPRPVFPVDDDAMWAPG